MHSDNDPPVRWTISIASPLISPVQKYGSSKLRTALEMRQCIENWPTAWALRMHRQRTGLSLLRFRTGTNVICRGGTRDWDVVHELMFAGGYAKAFAYLQQTSGRKVVLDLGGNIGLFSLLAAAQSEDLIVHAYEPGPPNAALFEMNRLANPKVGSRMVLHREAVGGQSRRTSWFFDESNPGGSSVYAWKGSAFDVSIRAFEEVVHEIQESIALVKIDIEGAEFELIEHTPKSSWEKIPSISLELHDDPASRVTQAELLDRMRNFGYTVEEERVCSYFLTRA